MVWNEVFTFRVQMHFESEPVEAWEDRVVVVDSEIRRRCQRFARLLDLPVKVSREGKVRLLDDGQAKRGFVTFQMVDSVIFRL
jgi:hypothetical protein